MAQFRRYKSIFGESKQEDKKASLKKESIIKALKKSLKEEEGMSVKEIDDVVGKIEGVITDVIDSHGVDNAVVDVLSDTVKSINSQNAIIDDISYMEKQLKKKYSAIFSEAEEGEEEEEEMEEAMESDEEDEMKESEYESDEEEMEEKLARRQKAISEMKKKLNKKSAIKEESEDEEEDEEEDEDMEESIYGFKPSFSEESMTDEGDNLIDDESGSDYDYLSIDDHGNAPSDRDMEAEDDDNASQDM